MQLTKNSWFSKTRGGLSLLTGVVIIFALYVNFKGFGTSNKNGKIIDDVINNTNILSSEDREYAKITKDILEFTKNETAKNYSYCFEAEKVNLLETSTFLNKELMQKNKELLENCIKQYERYDEQHSKMMKTAEGIIYSSNLTDAQRNKEVESFNAGINNPTTNSFSAVIIKEVINNYRQGINLYNFFIENIGKYELSDNSFHFTRQELADRYNELIRLINLSNEKLTKANDDLMQYNQKILKEEGVETNIKDAEKYMQNK